MATHFALTVLASEEGGHGFTRPLPMHPEVFGLIAVAVVCLALLFVWFFRRSATEPVDLHGAHGHGDQAAHGAAARSEHDRDHQAQQSHRGLH